MISDRVGTVEQQRLEVPIDEAMQDPGCAQSLRSRERSPCALQLGTVLGGVNGRPSREESGVEAHVEGAKDVAPPHEGQHGGIRQVCGEPCDGFGEERILGEPGPAGQHDHRTVAQRRPSRPVRRGAEGVGVAATMTRLCGTQPAMSAQRSRPSGSVTSGR